MDSDFVDHGTDIRDAIKVVIRKDNWVASKPWHADVVFPDGHMWRGWQQFFRTKSSLIRSIRASAPNAHIVKA